MLEWRAGRRDFLRIAGLVVLAGCSKAARRVAGSPTPSAPSSPTATPTRTVPLAWTKLTAKGPSARRDHSFTGSPDGSLAVLFGGRAGGTALGDTWIYEASSGTWARANGPGPSPRFGHNAAFTGDRLVLFGGQGGPTSFFNDVWTFEPRARRWNRVGTQGKTPAARYGAGSTVAGSSMLISHGFTNSGRFDDTWAFGARWIDVSSSSDRPVRRCLHRLAHLEQRDVVMLFGGQTDGVSHLGDTWLYDPSAKTWKEVPGTGPAKRNLYAAGATPAQVFVFGGYGAGGELNDLWSFDGAAWKRLSPAGAAPPPRGGIEGAMLGRQKMLVFGGRSGSGELDDLWELALP